MSVEMKDFRNGLLLRCVQAPDGCQAYVGREGQVYSASESLHGTSATWIWNMQFTGGAAEVPIRGYENWAFELCGDGQEKT